MLRELADEGKALLRKQRLAILAVDRPAKGSGRPVRSVPPA
jgi:hypothetical protein